MAGHRDDRRRDGDTCNCRDRHHISRACRLLLQVTNAAHRLQVTDLNYTDILDRYPRSGGYRLQIAQAVKKIRRVTRGR